MTSPFPGMDPYLEAHWRDVHGTLIVHARAEINQQLGNGLRASIEERLIVEQPGQDDRPIYGDVDVIDHKPANPSPTASTATGTTAAAAPSAAVAAAADGGAAVAEPLVMPIPREQTKQRYIEIVDASGGQVITVIEFVSPTNKIPGDGRDKYLQKQREVVAANLNLVEIDLTRGGQRETAFPVAELPKTHQTTYLACAYRGFSGGRFEVYAMPLRQRLPTIRIPLRDDDGDVVLDIQGLVDRAYEEGRYNQIDYRRPCTPPLENEDRAWTEGVLQATGR